MRGLDYQGNNRVMEYTSNPFVSVIIPVFNDAEHLEICLLSLNNQTYSKSFYEVIVVDNASDEEHKIEEVVARFGQASIAYESFPSSFGARNKGIALAKGDVIAFTDADCIPAPDWIEKGVKILLQTPNCGLVAGKIEIFFKNSNQITAVELYESLTAFPQKELIEKHKYAATANIFTFKKVIKKVGVFDANLKSSGDIEWGQRVASFGYKQVYANDTCVSHPARYSFEQLYRRTVRLAGGIYDLYNRRSFSLLQRNKMYTIKLVENLLPPINFIINIFLSSEIKSSKQKVQVSFVMFLVRYISARELIRLKLGGNSVRD